MSDDERAIRALIVSWIAASRAGDLALLLDLMTDDVVFMTPNRAPFGKAEFAADARRMQGLAFDADAEILEIEIVGTRAFARTRIEASMTAPDGSARRMSGYALSVLRRAADGRWRIARDANLVTAEA
jgi:uncharacterized protein (TIGR02246 family)